MEHVAPAMVSVESAAVEPVAPAIVPPLGRADFPTVLPCKRASQEMVLEAAATNEGKMRMLAAFERRIGSQQQSRSLCSLEHLVHFLCVVVKLRRPSHPA